MNRFHRPAHARQFAPPVRWSLPRRVSVHAGAVLMMQISAKARGLTAAVRLALDQLQADQIAAGATSWRPIAVARRSVLFAVLLAPTLSCEPGGFSLRFNLVDAAGAVLAETALSVDLQPGFQVLRPQDGDVRLRNRTAFSWYREDERLTAPDTADVLGVMREEVVAPGGVGNFVMVALATPAHVALRSRRVARLQPALIYTGGGALVPG